MTKLTAVILTKNEAINIVACIVSLRDWVDEVVVLDSGSTDETVMLAKEAGAQVLHRPFDNYAAQRQYALTTLAAEWILFVDADERLTPALASEIQQTVQQPQKNGYWIARRNMIVDHEMKAGGFYPDYQLRLLRRATATYVAEREVHEIVDVGNSEGWLQEPMIHLNYRSWSQFHTKQHFYAHYEAKILKSRGIRARPHNFVLQPLREFWRRFVTLHGWRDGWHGLRIALLLAWYYGFIPYLLLWRGAV